MFMSFCDDHWRESILSYEDKSETDAAGHACIIRDGNLLLSNLESSEEARNHMG